MSQRYNDIPSLTALIAFEASARLKSQSRAAVELGVTAGAISRQLRILEEQLGTELFRKSTRGNVLTDKGQLLYATTVDNLDATQETIRKIKFGSNSRRVTLACSYAIASLWLMPRLSDFWRKHPDIIVDNLISDDSENFKRAEVDLSVRYDLATEPWEASTILMKETLYPVCGAQDFSRFQDLSIHDLPNQTLLQVDWVDTNWHDWNYIFEKGAVSHRQLTGRRLGSFAVAIQATQDNQGISIGWHNLVKGLVASGKLHPVTDFQVDAPGAYYLTWQEQKPLSPAAEILKSWLVDQANN